MNVLSLFAGIGGLELGLERAGMTTVGQVEIDPYCQRVLARHWPEVPRHDDVRTAPNWWASEPRPTVDVVCGGFPCQPFSHAGKQLGVADERWGWPWMADVIRAVRPSYVLVENVAALTRDPGAFGTVLGDLHSLGLDAEWASLYAAEFGAPNPRRRVYVLAYPAGERRGPHDHLGASRARRSPIAARGLSGLPVHERRRAAGEWLERQPRLARLADGIPRQVERLRTLGNAVVPAVPEHLGHLINEDVAWANGGSSVNISDHDHVLDTPITDPDPTIVLHCRVEAARYAASPDELALFLLQLGLATDIDIRADLVPASDRDGYLRIPCQVCGASVGDRCVTLTNRNPTDPHTARVDQWYGARA